MATMLRFEPGQPPATPKDAATVVVVRGRPPGQVEIFCVKRHGASGFLGGAVVFPGGKLSAADSAPEWTASISELGERARGLANDETVARAFAVAAFRELFEEASLLPLSNATPSDAEVRELRAELARRTSGGGDDAALFRALLVERGLVLDASRLEALARWITPEAEPRRYDTRFYLIAGPAGQQGAHDRHETTSSFWASPEAILRMWERDEIFLAPPTQRTIQILSSARSVEDCYAIARVQPLDPICPYFAMDGEQAILALPGDPLHPSARPAPADKDAPTRYVIEGTRLRPIRAV
jgi:8-oxo-dGTP pyrophosphatase MutT (NUDIX family)